MRGSSKAHDKLILIKPKHCWVYSFMLASFFKLDL